MGISKPIRQNKHIVEATMDTVLTKPPTQKTIIKDWVIHRKEDFLINDLVGAFPHINRRVLEKRMVALSLDNIVTCNKCRCGCSNVFKTN